MTPIATMNDTPSTPILRFTFPPKTRYHFIESVEIFYECHIRDMSFPKT